MSRAWAPDEAETYRRAVVGMQAARRLVDAATGPCVVMLVDVDRLGSVNRRFGVRVGDAVLREVGAAVEQAVKGSGDSVALGGDRFLAIVNGPDAERVVREIVADLRRIRIRARFAQWITVSASAGGGWWSGHHGSVAEALLDAAAALDRAKQAAHYGSPVRRLACASLTSCSGAGGSELLVTHVKELGMSQ